MKDWHRERHSEREYRFKEKWISHCRDKQKVYGMVSRWKSAKSDNGFWLISLQILRTHSRFLWWHVYGGGGLSVISIIFFHLSADSALWSTISSVRFLKVFWNFSPHGPKSLTISVGITAAMRKLRKPLRINWPTQLHEICASLCKIRRNCGKPCSQHL